MKKSSFVAMILGTVSGILFAIGMCMALIPEWESFNQGVVLGCLGVILALITLFLWRKMENKEPVKISKKSILISVIAIIGILALGVGMCFCMVWNNMIFGIVIGVIGILFLLSLIPVSYFLQSPV